MWKIIKLFFMLKAVPGDMPSVIEYRIKKLCEEEVIPMSFVTFRRKSLNYFAMELVNSNTYWGFYFNSLEID